MIKAFICVIFRLYRKWTNNKSLYSDYELFGYDYTYDSYAWDWDNQNLYVGKWFLKNWNITHETYYYD
jgi:hypothetical protein